MSQPRPELDIAMDGLRAPLFGVAILSLVVNLLMLAGPLFMIAVYDHVLPTRNTNTLIGLLLLVLVAYALYGITDIFRTRAMARFATAITETISVRVFDAVMRRPLVQGFQADTIRPLQDIDEIKSYAAGPGMSALFDLPWIPIYLGICFAFHVYIGVAVLIGAITLVTVTLSAEALTRRASRQTNEKISSRNSVIENAIRNTEALMGMGMLIGILNQWRDRSDSSARASLDLVDRTGALLEVSKVSRMVLQSGVLALGAYLVILGQASPGIIIASSILSSRALAPVDQIISTWRQLLSARHGWGRISTLLAEVPPLPQSMRLHPPTEELAVEGVSLVPPGGSTRTLDNISFLVPAGSAVGVLGPSGSGKSSLVRTLVGIWAPMSGKVRIDSSDVMTWSLQHRRAHIGYLPQDVELMAGTVAENISRFANDASPETIIAAATQARVHELILRLPQGYDTLIGPSGSILSGGQKQRIALARALYGNPFLVVLDEPNSNLDAEGEAALSRAIMLVRQRGGIVVIVAHRETALASCDRVLIMQSGQLRVYGLKEEILRPRVTQIQASTTSPRAEERREPDSDHPTESDQ